MGFLLDKKLEHERKCEVSLRAQNYKTALFHAAKAAEFALALAEQTTGTIAERYVEDGEGWLEIAERLKTSPPVGGSSPRQEQPLCDSHETTSPDDGWLITEKPHVTFDMIAGRLNIIRNC